MKSIAIGHFAAAAALAVALPATASAEERRYMWTQADRLEHQSHDDVMLWDLQGWYGGDYHKFWWKLEGETDFGEDDESEVQLIYSRAYTSYFDVQFGVRFDDFDAGDDTSLVIGIQGLAPYRFELDAAVFVNEDGDVLLRGEFERDILLTQRLVLQPRAEINASLQDIPERNIGSGVSSTALGFRLRYEIRRELAPYIGVSWQKSYGDLADALEAAGGDVSSASLVAGVRFWF